MVTISPVFLIPLGQAGARTASPGLGFTNSAVICNPNLSETEGSCSSHKSQFASFHMRPFKLIFMCNYFIVLESLACFLGFFYHKDMLCMLKHSDLHHIFPFPAIQVFPNFGISPLDRFSIHVFPLFVFLYSLIISVISHLLTRIQHINARSCFH